MDGAKIVSGFFHRICSSSMEQSSQKVIMFQISPPVDKKEMGDVMGSTGWKALEQFWVRDVFLGCGELNYILTKDLLKSNPQYL